MSKIHYTGELGDFIYDDNMYEMKVCEDMPYLHFNTSYVGPIDLPKGLTNCSHMFADCCINEGCYFRNFDTSDVTDMSGMFSRCQISDGVTLGDKFDTSKVTDMNCMFYECHMPDGFTLGDKFNTSKVEDMCCMFCECHMPDGFTLGDKFNTSKVEDMHNMFYQSSLPKGFTLGDKFDTSNVKDIDFMFSRSSFGDDFSLPDKFDISNVSICGNIFENCYMPRYCYKPFNVVRRLERLDDEDLVHRLKQPDKYFDYEHNLHVVDRCGFDENGENLIIRYCDGTEEIQKPILSEPEKQKQSSLNKLLAVRDKMDERGESDGVTGPDVK